MEMGIRRTFRTLVLAVAGGTFICAIMVVARVEDALARGQSADVANEFPLSWPYFLPLMLLSWGLQSAFDRWRRLTRPLPAGLLFAAVMLIFFPGYIAYEGLLGMSQASDAESGLLDHLTRQSRFGWWIDGMIVMATFALHYGLATRSRLIVREADLSRQRTENAELRLALLQGQLEPHFLFNALNGVAALVRSGDRDRSLSVLEEISEMLRYALRASRTGLLTVQDELDFVDRYLSLQAMRFGPRLRIEREDMPIEWFAIPCPPLLIQPLVENAIRHGVETTSGDAQVRVSAMLEDEKVVIEVCNSIATGAEPLAGNGIGMSLVSGRLAAAFGDEGRLMSLKSENAFISTLSFPARRTDD